MKNNEKKTDYTYYFADGTKSIVTADEVGQDWIDRLYEMDEEERKKNYNYGRHNYPLSQTDYEGETFAEPNGTPFDELMREEKREKIDAALDTLTDCQRELFDKVFIERKKGIDIAAEQGVSHQAITRRIERVKKKLQKFLV